ncbi:MAG: hypothetical protein A3C74_01050 [Candidatus Magasanikbacteria bacterium RIFCSPHIGHO2_02_FULL_44_13]|nr:MAG: hypothetical protein A3C74_01050 [Candidatus Magasanikbacteria bacterium RIFCSPHIGHO2_02_FULL_44_13]
MERRLLVGWLGDAAFGRHPGGGNACDDHGVRREVRRFATVPFVRFVWGCLGEYTPNVGTRFPCVVRGGRGSGLLDVGLGALLFRVRGGHDILARVERVRTGRRVLTGGVGRDNALGIAGREESCAENGARKSGEQPVETHHGAPPLSRNGT